MRIVLLLNKFYIHTKIIVDISCSFKVIFQTKFKCDHEQRAITLKLVKAESWFLCIALLLNTIYQPAKFLLDTSCSFIVMSRTKFKCKQTTKCNNSNNWQCRVMVLMDCTSTQWDLSTYRVSCWYLL